MGPIFSTVYGVLGGFGTGPYTGYGLDTPGTVIPITRAATQNTPGAFTIVDGLVRINVSGVYIVTGRVQVASSDAGTFLVQVNGTASEGRYYSASSTSNGGTASITTVIILNAGDMVSNSIVSTTTVFLLGFIGGIQSGTSTLTFVKIANVPQGMQSQDVVEELPPEWVM